MEFDFTQAQYDAIVAAERIFELAVIAFALWRGDRTLRWGALIFLVSAIGVPLAELATPPTKYYLLVDAPAAIALLALTIHDPRPWALWASAFKIMIVASHVMYAVDHNIRGLAYATAVNTWLILADLALLAGAIAAARRRGREGAQAAT